MRTSFQQSADLPNTEDKFTEILRAEALACPRFQELRASSPGLAACIFWLEDWRKIPAMDLKSHMQSLAGMKPRSLCRRYQFPPSRVLLKLFSNWEKTEAVVVEKYKSHNCLLELRQLLTVEPEALSLLERSPIPSLKDVQRLLYGRISAPLGFFPRTWLLGGLCNWFFRLSALRRHHLAESWWALIERDTPLGATLPPLLHLCHFRDEKKALAYIERRNSQLSGAGFPDFASA